MRPAYGTLRELGLSEQIDPALIACSAAEVPQALAERAGLPATPMWLALAGPSEDKRKEYAQSGVAMSDGCLSGDTLIQTSSGQQRIDDAVGTQKLLTDEGWVDGEIRSFGVQQLWKVRLQRGERVEEVAATASHRWYLADGRVVTTVELARGSRIPHVGVGPQHGKGVSCSPATRSNAPSMYEMWAESSAERVLCESRGLLPPRLQVLRPSAGVATQSCGSKLRVSSNASSDQGSASQIWTQGSCSRVDTSSVYDLRSAASFGGLLCSRPVGWKTDSATRLQEMQHSSGTERCGPRSGSTGKCSQAKVSSQVWSSPRRLRSYAGRAGWMLLVTWSRRSGYGSKTVCCRSLPYLWKSSWSAMPGLQLVSGMGREGRRRASSTVCSSWTVVSIEPTDQYEHVYCGIVPGLHRFVLASGILTGNSFPIPDVNHLRKAIQAVGRAANYEKAVKHIKKRARALGKTSMLPQHWQSG